MNNRINIRFIVATLLTFVLASPLLAQESRQVGQERERVTREIHGRTVTVERPVLLEPTEANFEQYRSDLRAIMLAQKETAKLLQIEGAVDRILDPAMQQVAAMKFSDFSTNGLVDLSLFRGVVAQQKEAIAQNLAGGKARVAQFLPTDPFPGAQYSLNLCPLNPQPAEAAYVSGLVTLAAELVREVALDVCNQIFSALFGGGNVSLACLVTDAIYAAVKIIDYPIQFCDEDTTAGEIKGGYLRAEFVKDQLYFSVDNDNKNKAKLSTQMTNAENHIVTNDNNNKAALSSQTAAFQTLAVRSAIERNLAADPTTNAAVGLFQLPASRGGYLEIARQYLIDTYNAHVAAAVAAGLPASSVYNPATDLSLGATFTSQGKYREAYYYYRKGYRSVVKYP